MPNIKVSQDYKTKQEAIKKMEELHKFRKDKILSVSRTKRDEIIYELKDVSIGMNKTVKNFRDKKVSLYCVYSKVDKEVDPFEYDKEYSEYRNFTI